MADKLTDKQEKFCNEYLVDLNATQAAIRSGYSKKTANEQGCQLLAKLSIQERIAELRAELQKKTITPERIIEEYVKIALFNPKKLFDENGNLLPIQEMDDDTAAVIAGLDVQELKNVRIEKEAMISLIKKIKHVDKKGALDSLAKVFGMFIDKHEHTGRDGGPIIVDWSSESDN